MDELTDWLYEKGISTKKFSEMVRCSGTVIRKIKRGATVSTEVSKKVSDLTGGKVVPAHARRGRPRPTLEELRTIYTANFSEYESI